MIASPAALTSGAPFQNPRAIIAAYRTMSAVASAPGGASV
jgi:hypothetical protein